MGDLATQVVKKRAGKGIRETAKLIQISPATLSRVENGNVPDLDTFRKICAWLVIDPGTMLGMSPAKSVGAEIRVHFRKDSTVKQETAKALGEMILRAHEAMKKEEAI
jgi:transcriptional regulator with XRE-family HTH domain